MNNQQLLHLLCLRERLSFFCTFSGWKTSTDWNIDSTIDPNHSFDFSFPHWRLYENTMNMDTPMLSRQRPLGKKIEKKFYAFTMMNYCW